MKKIFILLSSIVLLYSCNNSISENAEANSNHSNTTPELLVQAGELTFNKNCKMCHGINASESSGLAPVLDSVKSHWPDTKSLGSYIKNAKENLNTSAYTTALYEQWKSKPQMPPFTGLSDSELEELIAYLMYVSK
jgi:mono/diheme cytochrome c family protein